MPEVIRKRQKASSSRSSKMATQTAQVPATGVDTFVYREKAEPGLFPPGPLPLAQGHVHGPAGRPFSVAEVRTTAQQRSQATPGPPQSRALNPARRSENRIWAA